MAVTRPQLSDQGMQRRLPEITALDAGRSVICFDRDSDTLYIHLYGLGRRAVSSLVGDYTYLLVDPQTDEVVGLQVEDVLTQAIDEYPLILDALSVAELRGITPAEIDLLLRQRTSDAIRDRGLDAAATKNRERRKQEVIESFLGNPSRLGFSSTDGRWWQR